MMGSSSATLSNNKENIGKYLSASYNNFTKDLYKVSKYFIYILYYKFFELSFFDKFYKNSVNFLKIILRITFINSYIQIVIILLL